jgi:hypothetical protein
MAFSSRHLNYTILRTQPLDAELHQELLGGRCESADEHSEDRRSCLLILMSLQVNTASASRLRRTNAALGWGRLQEGTSSRPPATQVRTKMPRFASPDAAADLPNGLSSFQAGRSPFRRQPHGTNGYDPPRIR